MLTEQNKKDILDYYREGYSVQEIVEMYPHLCKTDILNICAEEDESWSRI